MSKYQRAFEKARKKAGSRTHTPKYGVRFLESAFSRGFLNPRQLNG